MVNESATPPLLMSALERLLGLARLRSRYANTIKGNARDCASRSPDNVTHGKRADGVDAVDRVAFGVQIRVLLLTRRVLAGYPPDVEAPAVSLPVLS
ncbi:hypothetical protein MTP06_26940 [Streptomyces sp. PLM4]|nr:hypothetical protein MTP06_26940 [Streptomyces sp. PLM4]